tara:strand:- start:892 stop:1239 length:348 start_codon:yes stop_codon:yes gene_type:complete
LKNFKLKEFNCPCCNANNMQTDTLLRLQEARTISKTPYKINSGTRCAKRNAEVGGKENSSHLKGYAIDIHCTESRKRALILGGLIEAGFARIGIAKTFIHVDNDPDKTYGVVWVY